VREHRRRTPAARLTGSPAQGPARLVVTFEEGQARITNFTIANCGAAFVRVLISPSQYESGSACRKADVDNSDFRVRSRAPSDAHPR
jgi:hypothetical protein